MEEINKLHRKAIRNFTLKTAQHNKKSECHFTKVLGAPVSVQSIPIQEPIYLLNALVKWYPEDDMYSNYNTGQYKNAQLHLTQQQNGRDKQTTEEGN